MSRPWYEVDDADRLFSPALLVYRERVAANLQKLLELAGDPQRLRPHVKTHKMAEVIRLQQAAGIHKFKAATIAEAEMVAGCGRASILLAYPLVGPNVRRMIDLMRSFPDCEFLCLTDDPLALKAIAEAMDTTGLEAEVLVDLDVGMHRTGIAPERALELYQLIDSTPGVRPGGLHAYDGHIVNSDPEARRREVDAAMAPVEALARQITSTGLPLPRVIAGGSPTFPIHAVRRNDWELSPGTVVLWDAGYSHKIPDVEFQPAAMLLTRVVSKPTDDRLCLDLGHKAVSTDQDRRLWVPELPDAQIVSHSEEHLVLQTPRAAEFAIGQVLYVMPWHICPTAALYREATLVQDHQIADTWTVAARDRLLSI